VSFAGIEVCIDLTVVLWLSFHEFIVLKGHTRGILFGPSRALVDRLPR